MSMTGLPRTKIFHVSDGHGMAYRHYGFASSSLAVVLIHGSACFGEQLHAMAAAMSKRRECDVYTLDMRGHGQSDGERGHAVKDASVLVRDVVEFVAFLRARRTPPRVILGGHSAGGGLALAVSRSSAASQIAGYLFVAPFLGFGSMVDRPAFGGWVSVRGIPMFLLGLANVLGIRMFNDRPVMDFATDVAGDERYVEHWSFSTLLAFGPGVWSSDAPQIDRSKPVLVLAGSGDECFRHPLYPLAFTHIAPHASIPQIGTPGHWDVLVDPLALAEATRWLANFVEVPVAKHASPPAPTPSPSDEGTREMAPARRWLPWRSLVAQVGMIILLLAGLHAPAKGQQVPPAQTSAAPPSAERFYVRLGAAGVIFEPDSTFRVEGQKVPGARFAASSNATLAGEAGYYVTPHISLSVTGGLPPKTRVTGEGSLAPFGLLGSARYGTLLGLADYHFKLPGRFQPWVGAGPVLLLVITSESAAIQNLRVSNRWGVGLQAGADYMLTQRWGLYGSVTQNFVGSQGRGTFGPYAVQTKFNLDPFVLQAGVELKF